MGRFYLCVVALTIVAVGCSGGSDDGVDEDSGALDGSHDARRNDDALRETDAPRVDGPLDAADVSFVDREDGGRPPDAHDSGSSIDVSDVGRVDAHVDSLDARPDISKDGLDGGADISADDADVRADESADTFDGAIDVSVDGDALIAPETGRDATDDERTDHAFEDAATLDVDADDACSDVTCNLVSIAVTPVNPTVTPHSTHWMQATGAYADNSVRDITKHVTWSGSSRSVLHISNRVGTEGLVTARMTGSAIVTAGLGVVSGSTTVNVGTSDPAVLRLTPSVASIAVGTRQPMKATVIFSDAASWADWWPVSTWSSSAPSVATVTDGVVSAVAPGTTTITATVAWLTATATLTVTPATVVSLALEPAMATLPIGPKRALQAIAHFSDGTTQNVTEQSLWGSTDITRAVVDDTGGSKGKVTGVGVGSAAIFASYANIAATAAIDVSTATLQSLAVLHPPSSRLMMFLTLPMSALGFYSGDGLFDLTDQTTWTSTDGSIVEVSGRYITGVGEGTAVVHAHAGGLMGQVAVEVRAGVLSSIAVTPNPASVVRGASIPFYATGTYADGSTYDLTRFLPWNTVDPSVAWIDNPTGESPPTLTGVNAGTTNVTAYWSGVGGSSVVTVTSMR